MWKEGLTLNTLEVFEKISKLECIKGFHLCGGTGIALQLNHRYSEDLDFEMLTVQGKKEQSKSLNHDQIVAELKSLFDDFKMGKVVTADHFDCLVGDHVKLSFYKPQNKVPVLNEVGILNNLKTVSPQDALGMKLYVITQRSKFRDYYDIYSLLKEGCSLSEGIQYALKFSRYNISSKNIVSKLMSEGVFVKTNKEGHFEFDELKSKYHVDASQIRDFIEEKLRQVQIKKIKIDTTAYKSIGRLFYETLRDLDDIQLSSVLDKLLEYKKTESVDRRLDFVTDLLLSVGVKVVPYDSTSDDILQIRREKDIESISRIDSIFSEFQVFQKLNAEIKKQNEVIEKTHTLQIDSSMKETIVNNCLSQIDGLQEQKQKLLCLKEFERAEKVKCKTPKSDDPAKKRKPLDFSEEESEKRIGRKI